MGDTGNLVCELCKSIKTKDGRPLRRCGGCGIKTYCSPECQKTHWTEGGHKEECKKSRKAGKPDDVYEDVVNRLKACPEDAQSMIHILHDIEHLSINEENRPNRKKFASLNIVTPLLHAARFHAAERLLIGHFFTVIGHLCQDDENHAALMREGVLDLIATEMKTHAEDPSIVGQALFAVAFMTIRYEKDILQLFHAGGICEALLSACATHYKRVEVAAWGCKAMVGLSKLSDAKSALREGAGPALVLSALRSFPRDRYVALYGLQALANLVSDVEEQAAGVILEQGNEYEKELLTQGCSFMKANLEICALLGKDNQACEVVMTVVVANQGLESVVKFGCNVVALLVEVPANKEKFLSLKCKSLLTKLHEQGVEKGMTKPYEEALGLVLLKFADDPDPVAPPVAPPVESTT